MAPRNRYLGNLEPGYEYLCSLHDPAIESTSVPAVAGSLLASLQCPHQPLDNRIHPLFELRNWRRIKFKEHKLLRPAIVLASLLLKVPAFSQWWEHTLRGTWQYDSERKLGYLADPKDATCERAHDIKLGVLDPIDVFDNKLPDLLRFGFHPLAAPDGTYLDAKSFGSKETFDDFCAGSEIEAHSFTSAWIMLHSHYLYDLKHLQTYGSPGDLEHIYLRIAITLCHELAHIAWKYRTKCDRLEVKGLGDFGDPLHRQSDGLAEMGHSWERFAFGGSIWAIDHPGHLTIYYIPPSIFKGSKASSDIRIIVPRWWIHKFFRKSTWENFGELHERGEIQLPTEAESKYVFRKHTPEWCLWWTLYKEGVMQNDFLLCMMLHSSPLILWNIIRPREEHQVSIVADAPENITMDAQTPKELPVTNYFGVGPNVLAGTATPKDTPTREGPTLKLKHFCPIHGHGYP